MAKSKSSSKMTPRDYEAIGPSESGYEGFGPEGANPSNPSDAIFMGRTLPMVMPVAVTARRDFNEPVRTPLHFDEGPGTDENVTSRRPKMTAPHGNITLTLDHDDVRPIQGYDHNLYSHQPDVSVTENGVPIYGT